MKKIITAVGLVAVGIAGAVDAHAQSKPWSISASLRGFYDDNYATAPSQPIPGTTGKRSSWGTELSPAASYNLVLDQTTLHAAYVYDMRYYEDRRINDADHSHKFDLGLDHNFSERYTLNASESFVIAQEPGILDPSGVTTFPLRSDGNNLRNNASVAFRAQVTPLLSTELSYQNTYYDYQQTGAGSYSALLDRDEHLAALNTRWQLQPDFLALLGYQFGLVNQDSHDSLLAGPFVSPKVRDNRSQYVYVGGDYSATSQLTISGRVGIQYIEYPNAVPGSLRDSLNPYVDFNVTYAYAPDSTAQLGVINRHAQTDVVGGAIPTLDQEATSVYFNVNHKITAKLTGQFITQFQYSTFNGGTANSQAEQYLTVGLNVSYEINSYLTAETGYNYDRLRSDLANRSYYRDRLYLGIKATY